MKLRVNLENKVVRVAGVILLIVFVGLLGRLILVEFLIGTFSDDRISNDDRSGLITALDFAPNASKLRSRLAELQYLDGDNPEAAEENIDRAIRYSSSDYKLYLLQAKILEANGKKPEAEKAFTNAIQFAQNYTEVYWQLGNFYVRQNDLTKAVESFKVVSKFNPRFIPATLDIVWRLSNNDVLILENIVKGNSESQLKLAIFLAKQKRAKEAEEVFSKINKGEIKDHSEFNKFYTSLFRNGYPRSARRLWASTNNIEDISGIFNGSFEEDDFAGPTQLDWRLSKSKYARIRTGTEEKQSGKRSLLVNFKGLETTKILNEISHALITQPEKNLVLTFYVKTEKFLSESLPKVVVTNSKNTVLSESSGIPTGSNDWKCMEINFSSPMAQANQDSEILYIKVRKAPKYAFEEPTFGKIWFDDFAVSEGKTKC